MLASNSMLNGTGEYLVPVLGCIRYAQLQQHQLLMLADAPSDAVVHTLAAGGWVFQLHIVVTAGGADDCKSAPVGAHSLLYTIRLRAKY